MNVWIEGHHHHHPPAPPPPPPSTTQPPCSLWRGCPHHFHPVTQPLSQSRAVMKERMNSKQGSWLVPVTWSGGCCNNIPTGWLVWWGNQCCGVDQLTSHSKLLPASLAISGIKSQERARFIGTNDQRLVNVCFLNEPGFLCEHPICQLAFSHQVGYRLFIFYHHGYRLHCLRQADSLAPVIHY